MADPDRACPHEEFESVVVVNRLEDSGRFQLLVRVACTDCGEPFVFIGEMPFGVDLNGVAISLDRRELRVAILPEVEASARAL